MAVRGVKKSKKKPGIIQNDNYLMSDQESNDFIPRESRVFRAVICQLLIDAVSDYHKLSNERHDARNWLLNNKRDFEAICDLAMLDHKYVREKVRNYLNER